MWLTDGWPPNLFFSTMQQSANLSILRLYTRNLPSAWLTVNRDSLVNNALFQSALLQFRWRRAHNSLAARWRWVIIWPVYGRRALIGWALRRNRLRMVCPETPYCIAVNVAANWRWRKCVNVMKRSALAVVTRGLPGRCRSWTVPVCWYRAARRSIVFRQHPNRRATTLADIPPASNCPISLVFGKTWHIENSEKLKKKNIFRMAPIAWMVRH